MATSMLYHVEKFCKSFSKSNNVKHLTLHNSIESLFWGLSFFLSLIFRAETKARLPWHAVKTNVKMADTRSTVT